MREQHNQSEYLKVTTPQSKFGKLSVVSVKDIERDESIISSSLGPHSPYQPIESMLMNNLNYFSSSSLLEASNPY